MQWTNSENAGFTDGQPWIEVQKNYEKISVMAEENDDTSILAFYKKLIAFRKQQPIISQGSIHFFGEMSEAVMGYEREWQGKKMVVLCNFNRNKMHKYALRNILKILLERRTYVLYNKYIN